MIIYLVYIVLYTYIYVMYDVSVHNIGMWLYSSQIDVRY